MMNPFRKSPKALNPRNRKDINRWVRPQQAWDQLEAYVENEENVVILGVEGSGKSSLLKFFFSTQRCREAAEANKLIFTADLSDTEDGNDLCEYLIDRLMDAAQTLLPETVNSKLERTKEKAKEKSPKQTFVDLCNCLGSCEYTTLLVMDGFEHFVSSPNITQDQHDMLRSLLDKDIMRCVVATNYDLERTSLPENVQGSLYLQKFQPKVTLQGFTDEEAVSFLDNMLADNTIHFNEKQIRLLLDYTGGIPGLFEMSASHMYDMVEERGGVAPVTLQEILYDASRNTLQRWCKFFTREYEEVIDFIRPELKDPACSVTFTIPHSNQQNRTAAARLCDRGLWEKTVDEEHRFNSLLLQNYFYNREYVPQHQAELVSVGAPAPVPISALGGAGTPVVFSGATIHITHNNNTYNQQTYNQIINMATTKELLDMITSADAGREGIANNMFHWLTSRLPADGLLEVQRQAGMSDAEYDALYDHEFSKHYSDQVVDSLAVDENDELADISEKEQLTLDQRFREARAVTRPELTDAILEKVSARTGFYLKLSVVVEDALSILKLMQGKDQEGMDCSPQLILYGKAVEQQLKDSFFPLFNQEAQLKTYQIRLEGSGWTTFENALEERTCIGNYMHAIRDNVSRLGTLCVQQGLLRNGVQLSADQWQSFWRQLDKRINKARILRNLSAHTSRNNCPKWEDVDKIAQLSFGLSDGSSIFECCSVCSDLKTSLFGNGT